jgi:hypothetical protein
VRSKVVFRPGAGGLITDPPTTMVKPESLVYAVDAIFTRGVLQQRWGYSYESTGGKPSGDTSRPYGIWRAKFSRAGVTCTVLSSTAATVGGIWLEQGASTGKLLYANPAISQYVPRCLYRDELIFCNNNGTSPILRYSGSSELYSALPAGTVYNFLQNQSSIVSSLVTGSSASALAAQESAYHVVTLGNGAVKTQVRAAKGATNSTHTLEDTIHLLLPPSGVSGITGWPDEALTPVASRAFPCIETNSDGSIQVAATTVSTDTAYAVTGYGTDFSVVNTQNGTALLYYDTAATKWKMRQFEAVTTLTSATLGKSRGTGVTAYAGTTTISAARFVNPPTWTDCTVHKGSLWGTGVLQYPTRVYVAPPDWNPAMPPGATYPYDASAELWASSPSNWLLDFIDVPSRADSDPVVAVLSSPGPLLVLKKSSVYAIHGTFPNFDLALLASGVGCLSRTSAVTIDGTPYWAGKQGVFTYRGGQIVNLTKDKIGREWQGLTNGWQDGTSYCTIGVVSGHLVVSIRDLYTTAFSTGATALAMTGPDVAPPARRTFVFDLQLGEWISRMSNCSPLAMHSSRVAGEVDGLLCSSNETDSTGKVIDFAPCFSGIRAVSRTGGTVNSAYANDPAVDYNATEQPRFEAWTPEGLGGIAGVDGEARLVDASVVASVYNSAAPAGPGLLIQVAPYGGLRPEHDPTVYTANWPTTSVTLGTIPTVANQEVTRTRYRVGLSGRTHQMRFKASGQSLSTTVGHRIQVHEAVLNFRDSRPRS